MLSITLILIVITAFISWRAFENAALKERMMHSPYLVKHERQYHRLLSHALIHSDWMHLAFNMFVLWSFGQHVEHFFTEEHGNAGRITYLLLYALAALAATLPSMRKHGNNPDYRSVGASGAVSAVMVAAMFISPDSRISFFFLPGVPAYIAIVLFFVLEHVLSRTGRTNIAHDAHIWGALFGIAFMGLLEPEVIANFFSYVKSQLMG
ncbi:MAG: rhomboid family intramembrane serine protease [Flavobacteriales bacterium]